MAVKQNPKTQSRYLVNVLADKHSFARGSVLAGTFDEMGGVFEVGNYVSTPKGKHAGREMISTAIEAIGPEKVRAVRASFDMAEEYQANFFAKGYSTNLDAYTQILLKTNSPEEAAWQTPFGKAMRDLGFNHVRHTGKNAEFEFSFK